MKLKTILSAGLAMLLLASGSLAAASEEPAAGTKGEQTQLIVSNLSVWKPVRKGDYTLTDLDGNGRYEIITAKVSKKQATEIHAWEVDPSGSYLLPVAEPWGDDDSQPDIRSADGAEVYYDAENDVRYYIFEDVREEDAGTETDLAALSLKNGAFTFEVLATKTETGYSDGSGEPIDAAAYENAAAERFAGLEKLSASFAWIDTTEHPLDSAPMEQILELAEGALAGFQITEAAPASGEPSGGAS